MGGVGPHIDGLPLGWKASSQGPSTTAASNENFFEGYAPQMPMSHSRFSRGTTEHQTRLHCTLDSMVTLCASLSYKWDNNVTLCRWVSTESYEQRLVVECLHEIFCFLCLRRVTSSCPNIEENCNRQLRWPHALTSCRRESIGCISERPIVQP